MSRRPDRAPLPQPLWRARALTAALAGLLLLVLAPAAALAQPLPQTPEAAGIEQMAREFLQPALAAAAHPHPGTALRIELVVGALDRRLRLAPCARIEPHLPANIRPWGRSRIGLRCVDGTTRWNVFLPITVHAWGPAWVLRRPVGVGTVLTQEDAELAEIDWAAHNAVVLANPALWVGQEAAHALLPGQALRQHMVRPALAFAAGTQVRVLQTGAGFQVATKGQALGVGHIGQSIRVRLPGGRVVSGLVRDSQTVEMTP